MRGPTSYVVGPHARWGLLTVVGATLVVALRCAPPRSGSSSGRAPAASQAVPGDLPNIRPPAWRAPAEGIPSTAHVDLLVEVDGGVAASTLSTTLRQLCEGFRAAVLEAPSYADYLRCAEQEEPTQEPDLRSCAAFLDRAMWFAFYRSLRPDLHTDRYALETLSMEMDPGVQDGAWMTLFASSDDVIDRVALLAARARMPQLTRSPLPDGLVVEHSDGASVPESAFVLDAVTRTREARTPAVTDALVRRASSPGYDGRLRTRAIVALGHESSGASLNHLLSNMTTDIASLVASQRAIIAAVPSCGSACQPAITGILSIDDPALQQLQSSLRRVSAAR